MEVPVDLSPMLGASVCRLDAMRMKQLQHPDVYKAIDAFGELSAQAMMLAKPLTSSERIMNNPEHALYLMWQKDEEHSNKSYLLGMLKVGRKQLFFYDRNMQTYHGKVLCVLDFYVHHKRQREGIGRHLFDFMLAAENVTAGGLALDNPSVTCLAFMSKHFTLHAPIWQNTNFVVFESFFTAIGEGSQEEDGKKAIDGWERQLTPKMLGAGATENRWLHSLGMDTASRERAAISSASTIKMDTDGTLASRAQSAKQRKQHILSSNPLW